jgi:hypothetical protein
MKRLTVILSVLFTAIAVPVHAAPQKTMVIIDDGIDISHPAISNNIIYEVCIANYKSCPNGQNFMEGKGSSAITKTMATNKEWQHGTKVASAATQTDSNVKIIEIRCASLIAPAGIIWCNSGQLTDALNWVIANQIKFNIGAVVSPLGSYSTSCNTLAPYAPTINKLVSLEIPVFFPTGNDFKYTSIDDPSCIPGVIATTAIDDKGRLALYANYSDRVDFAANGNMNVAVPFGTYESDFGTSLSVAVLGTDWMKIKSIKNLSYKDTYNLIKNTATNYTNIMVKKNVLAINIDKAIQ